MQELQGLYKPEIFHAVRFIREGIHYTVYKSGKVIITGIKSEKYLDNREWCLTRARIVRTKNKKKNKKNHKKTKK